MCCASILVAPSPIYINRTTIVRISDNRLHVTWMSPEFSNGHLLRYNVTVHNDWTNYLYHAVVELPSSTLEATIQNLCVFYFQ